jgi:hypothetical protein
MRPRPTDLEQLLADKAKVESALRAAVREALARHKRAGNRVAVWRDGKVVWLSPEAIPEGNAGLARPDERQALDLELGKNVCAVGVG